MTGWATAGDGFLTLAVRIQPRAPRDAIVGLHGDRLKLRIAAAPEGGAANERLRRYVADLFGIPLRQVTLLAGHAARDKLLRIDGARALPATLADLGNG